jgi:hypothetical protein
MNKNAQIRPNSVFPHILNIKAVFGLEAHGRKPRCNVSVYSKIRQNIEGQNIAVELEDSRASEAVESCRQN